MKKGTITNNIMVMVKGVLLLCLFTFLPSSLTAQETDSISPSAQPHQLPQLPQQLFGYLSYDTALIAMPQYQDVQKQMQTLRKAYESELQRVEEEFNRKYEDFLEGQKEFPRTILLKRQTELQDMLQRNLEFKRQGLEDLEQAERKALAPLRIHLNEAIAKIAREKKLALVINTDANACPFIEPLMGVDLNKEVQEIITK